MSTDLYVVGNTGVGKSLLCNCLLGKWDFESKNQADSCTRDVSFVESWIEAPAPGHPGPRLPMRIFNIPGLLEADPERVKQNVNLLQTALDRKEPSIVLYVLTTEGGRIRDGDYAGFKALSEAYDFSKHNAFAFVVNKCTKRDKKDEITNYIHRMLAPYPVAFVPNFEEEDTSLQQEIATLSCAVRPILVDLLRPLVPALLPKKANLMLDVDQIRKLKEESRQSKIQFEQELNSIRQERNNLQAACASTTSQLATVKTQLAQAQAQVQQAQQQQHHRDRGIRLGPLKIKW